MVDAREYIIDDISPRIEFTIEVLKNDTHEPLSGASFIARAGDGEEKRVESDDSGTIRLDIPGHAGEIKIALG